MKRINGYDYMTSFFNYKDLAYNYVKELIDEWDGKQRVENPIIDLLKIDDELVRFDIGFNVIDKEYIKGGIDTFDEHFKEQCMGEVFSILKKNYNEEICNTNDIEVVHKKYTLKTHSN